MSCARRAAQDAIYTRGRLGQVQEGILEGMSDETRLLLLQGAMTQLQPRAYQRWVFTLWRKYTNRRKEKNARNLRARLHWRSADCG